jgi:eukaryotic-like serine/threonine-protein kinase
LTLEAGSRFGPYRVQTAIGAGGMGEVYRARDENLGRDVALKILPSAFATDPERLARFEREARVLAALNHPNIAGIHGVEANAGVKALVMELVEGPTLAERIAVGPLPAAEALAIARQIADALDAAHASGIVHRDLKPLNVKVRPDGVVKVLDLGLAKAMMSGYGRNSDAVIDDAERGGAHAPSVTQSAITWTGEVLGTVAYMSPEQAMAKPLDARSDIWAFGCVLFEMLTGRAAFLEGSAAETLARIIDGEPPWEWLPLSTSPRLKRLLRRCLEKDPRRRLHAAGDVRIELEEIIAEPRPEAPHFMLKSRARFYVPAAVVALLAAVAALTWGAVGRRSSNPVLPSLRLSIDTGPTNEQVSFALSPDGQHLAFVALQADTPQLFLRKLDQSEARPVSGTEGARLPFWSPDNRSLGFFADGLLKRVDIAGGRPLVLAHARNPMGGAWSADNVILFAPFAASPLVQVPARGGPSSIVTRLAPGEVSHRSPSFLPGRGEFLYLVTTSNPADQVIWLGSLSNPERRDRVIAADTGATYVPSGHLLFVRDDELHAVPFDAERGVIAGDSTMLARQVASEDGGGAFSVGDGRLLTFRAGEAMFSPPPLVWRDRAGRLTTSIAAQGHPAIAPTGSQIAVSTRTVVQPMSNTDIWLVDSASGEPRRFTFDPAFDITPVWSPDAKFIAFASNRRGVFDLFEKPVSFARDERVLLESATNKYAADWSPDGQHLLFVSESAVTGDDLWILSLGDTRHVVPFVIGERSESQGQFSPDGRYVAYRSNESGRWEIFVRPYPGPGSQQLVGAGIQPRWRRDGKELFYVDQAGRLTARSIQVAGDGGLRVGSPVTLFAARIGNPQNMQFSYAIDERGQQFLIATGERISSTPITVVQNWTAGLPH